MKLQRILVATDFSPVSDYALKSAESLARAEGAVLEIVHVMDHVISDSGFAGFTEDVQKESAELLAAVKALARDLDVPASCHLLNGNPASQLLEHAEREDVDLIVLGTHGRRGVTRLLLGSVAEAVVRGASCPVLTLKIPRRSDVSVPDQPAPVVEASVPHESHVEQGNA